MEPKLNIGQPVIYTLTDEEHTAIERDFRRAGVTSEHPREVFARVTLVHTNSSANLSATLDGPPGALWVHRASKGTGPGTWRFAPSYPRAPEE